MSTGGKVSTAAAVHHGAGFHRGVREFFLYYLICFSAMLVNSALYRLLASALPNLDVATAGGVLRKPARSAATVMEQQLRPLHHCEAPNRALHIYDPVADAQAASCCWC